VSEFVHNLNLFKTECREYNDIEVRGKARWQMTPKEGQYHGSVVFAVPSAMEQKILLRTGLNIAGRTSKVVNYRTFSPTTQCRRCQGFGHDPEMCKRPVTCAVCSKNHHTKAHSCRTCMSTLPCPHTPAKCKNCDKEHLANSQHCEIIQALRVPAL